MLSFLTLPFLASAALAASHLPRRDFHHHLARDLAASANVTANVTTTTGSANGTVDMVAAGYFTGWHAAGQVAYNFTVDDVSWEKYTHLIYAFS